MKRLILIFKRHQEMTLIMENHLKEMKGIFLDSKQEVIE